MKKRIFFCTSLIVFIISNSACAYYPVIDLGTLGGNASCAYSVNNNGQIVGYSYKSSAYGSYACLFDSTGGGANKSLGGGIAYSINNSGQIVGFVEAGSSYRAYLFDPTGGGANINLNPTGYSYAYSINDNGWIAGSARDFFSFDNYYRACLFIPSGNVYNKINLQGFPDYFSGGNPSGYAHCINNDGQIIGEAFKSDPRVFGGGYYVACRFSMGDYAWLLDGEVAAYIADNGQIVGRRGGHAWLFNPDNGGTNIDLGILGGYSYSRALSVNDNDQIVGYVYSSSGDSHACLFDSKGGGNNIDLNTLIDPSSGWTLTSANGINNNGWIVGTGIIGTPVGPFVNERAFLLVIPEPTTIALLAFGGLVVLSGRKNKMKEK